MKTLEKLQMQMQKASSLADKTAIRIKMIELNRASEKPDRAIISPMSTFLNSVYCKYKHTVRYTTV